MTAQVKNLNGTPTLFLDGKPAFYGMMWGSGPTPDGYLLKECARYYGEAGVHIHAFDVGAVGAPYAEWCGPKDGLEGHYDFSTVEQRFQQVIDANPQARFHLRTHLEVREFWQKLYPDECEVLSNGKIEWQSFASKLWRQQANDFLRAFVAHIEEIGLGDRVVAYQCGAGHTGEWVKGTGAMGLICGDYSRPMREHFQAWLRQRYENDEGALRAAWANPNVTFETAQVPPAEMQLKTTQYTFRDPKKEGQVIDYYRCLADLCGGLVVDFCTTIKDATQGKALAGAFFGYLMELAWNAGFFAEGKDSEYSTYQRSGHLGLWQVLQSPNVDFLVSPYSYGFRGIGGEGPAMPPSESMRIHGKLYVFEEDSRTHLTFHDHPNFGKADTLEESIAILRRNLAYVVTHGQGIWWLAGSPQTPHIELSQQPAFQPMIQRFQEIGTLALQLDNTPSAEVAVLLDDESFYYEWVKNSLDLPLIFQQRLWGLPHMGAPFDVYMLQDLLDGNLKPYKLYVFLNPFRLDKNRREALTGHIRKEKRVALWIYAPGFLNEDYSVGNMAELTGIGFGSGEHPWGPMIHLVDLDHPITHGLTQDLTWGTNSLLGPVFHVADYSVRVLGNVVYSQGRCRPGFVVKEFPEWTSIYSAAPNLPAQVLRNIARFARVHIYNDQGDTLYATPQLLGVHTAAGGERTFRLPRAVEVVYDLFEKKLIAQATDTFSVTLPRPSTMLYYTGDEANLKSIENIPG